MKNWYWLPLLIGVILVAASLLLQNTNAAVRKGRFTKATVVSRFEQAMYWRLAEAFPAPEYVVFGQVSFGALLNACEGASRNHFSQKRADFVLFDKLFRVLAVIELDDSSHRTKGERDKARDAMLTSAGYTVLRYTAIPDAARLRAELTPPPEPNNTARTRP